MFWSSAPGRRSVSGSLRRKLLCPGSSPLRRHLAFESLEDRRLLTGTTILSHGHTLGGVLPGYIVSMGDAIAERIAQRAGGQTKDVAQFRLTITREDSKPPEAVLWQYENGFAPSESDPRQFDLRNSLDGEAVIVLDWSDAAVLGEVTTQDVATTIVPFIQSLGPLGQQILSGSIHMIGHSRGGSLIEALSEDLGEVGIWVDHLTHLDTYPLSSPPDWGQHAPYADGPFPVVENVVFADNFWRRDGINPAEPFDFDGQVVSGAYDVEMNENVLGGYFIIFDPGYTNEHLDIQLWLHATIDTVGDVSDGVVRLSESDLVSWFDKSQGMDGPRDQTGYHFSRVGNGARPTVGMSDRLPGGSGARVDLDWSAAQWPNLFNLQAGSGSRSYLIGESMEASFQYSDFDSTSSVSFFLDPDRNPHNENQSFLIRDDGLPATGELVAAWQSTLPLADASPGVFFVGAQIMDPQGNKRFLYDSNSVSIIDIPWNNRRNPLDVNADGNVTPVDALILIEDLNENGARDLPVPPVSPDEPPPYLDPTGDNSLSPIDALVVITALSDSGSAEGENPTSFEGEFKAPILFPVVARRATHTPVQTSPDGLGLSQGATGIDSKLDPVIGVEAKNAPQRRFLFDELVLSPWYELNLDSVLDEIAADLSVMFNDDKP